jgi:HK97 family phage prohead protease
MSETPNEELEVVNGGELVYREAGAAILRAEADDAPAVLEGRMMPYGQWTEIRSRSEGHFLERFAPGALTKTLAEQASKIRVLFEHGLDVVIGKQAIAEVEGFRDEEDAAYYRGTILEGLPPLLLSGLRRGLYGSSIRFGPVKWDRTRYPMRSEHNPERREERTIREAIIKEISVVTFPAYAGATASVRSITDEIAVHQLLRGAQGALELPPHTETEPPHSEPQEPEEGPGTSRRTQGRDYLQPREEDPTWRL